MRMKAKIVLFGASELALETARETINFENCEIVGLCDNNQHKWHICFEGLEVIAPNDLIRQTFDYILVAAWRSYTQIYKQLLALGIEEKKILPLLQERKVHLLTDKLELTDEKAIDKLFLEGKRIKKKIQELNDVCETYRELLSVEDAEFNTDFGKYPLIAHALGGMVNGRKEEYSNSFEALTEAIEAGFHMFECDVWGASEKGIVLGSRVKMVYPVHIDYTILTLERLLELISADEKNKVILDLKYNTIEGFYQLLDKINALVTNLEHTGINVRNQIIVEVFDDESIVYAKKQGWECVLTNYRNKDGMWMQQLANICCKYDIKTLFLNKDYVMIYANYLKYILDKNIQIVCYVVDDIDEYATIKKCGVTSVLTNFMKPSP